MAEGERPVPFRTRKLSPPAPMVLHPPGCGRVGHRRTQTPLRGPRVVGGPLVLRAMRGFVPVPVGMNLTPGAGRDPGTRRGRNPGGDEGRMGKRGRGAEEGGRAPSRRRDEEVDTARPELPVDAEASELDREVRQELLTLPKGLADLVGSHLVAALDRVGCPAASYSPTPSPVQYHRRWRA